jgi:single-stranded DNA-binding protein
MSILCAFVGTLIADAKPRTSQAGKTWTSLNVRIGHGENTQWATVAVFGDDAAGVADLKEGSAVFVEGRIELRRWENHGGQKMSGLNVAASFCKPIDLRSKPKRNDTARHDTHAPLQHELEDPDAWRAGLASERRYA